MRIQLKGMSFRMESGNIAFCNGEEEKVFVGIVDEEEEKVLHLRAQRQKGKGYNPYYNVRVY